MQGLTYLSVSGLFPGDPEAAQDRKCVVTAKVIEEMVKSEKMPPNTTQKSLQQDAQGRYAYLSKNERLSLQQANQLVYSLFRKGVTEATAREYYAFLLSDKDIEKWNI